jgi:hypothetical protein
LGFEEARLELDRRQAVAGVLATALPWPAQGESMTTSTSYAAVALQLAARSIEAAPDRAAASRQMLKMISEVDSKLRGASIFVTQYSGSPVRLAVLPEYLFTSYPGRISIRGKRARI